MKKLFFILTFLITLFSQAQIIRFQVGGVKGVTTTQRNTLTVPAGQYWFLYNTTTSQWEYWDGAAWSVLGGAGSGNVSNTGTPVDNQVAVWTNSTTIEGDASFTWNGSSLAVIGTFEGQSFISPPGSNADININPDGTGNVALGNFIFDADATIGAGQDNYVLTYDHSTTSWGAEPASGGGGSLIINDDGATKSIAANSLNFIGAIDVNEITADNFDIELSAATLTSLGLADTALQNVVEDTTPQLGGNLDTQDFDISNSAGTIKLAFASGGVGIVETTNGSQVAVQSDGDVAIAGGAAGDLFSISNFDNLIVSAQEMLYNSTLQGGSFGLQDGTGTDDFFEIGWSPVSGRKPSWFYKAEGVFEYITGGTVPLIFEYGDSAITSTGNSFYVNAENLRAYFGDDTNDDTYFSVNDVDRTTQIQSLRTRLGDRDGIFSGNYIGIDNDSGNNINIKNATGHIYLGDTAGNFIDIEQGVNKVSFNGLIGVFDSGLTADGGSNVTSTGDVLVTGNIIDSGKRLTANVTKAITIEDPTSSEDISLFFSDEAITITQINSVCVGTTPSVTWTIRHSTDRSATGNQVVTGGTTTTSTTTGVETTSFNDATIPAGSWVWLETTATSGTINEINITLTYDAD